MKQGQFPAVIELSDFNGKNGFVIDGEPGSGSSGYSITAVGDVNGDQRTDLIIGAISYNNHTGRSYVVFGGPEIGSSGELSLSSLDGTNGFRLDGEEFGDASGVSISGIGDFNGDGIADILIGADGHNGTLYLDSVGRSYLVYGGENIGVSSFLSLSDLDGTNGFKLDGEAPADTSGKWTSTLGDVNGDGLADLLISAYGYNLGVGRCYVVFGTRGMVGDGGLLSLSSLDGTNGFKIDGEEPNDQDGNSYGISVADDMNGDGWKDILIGAPVHNNLVGRSYVIFGGPDIGSSSLINLADLNGTNGYKLDGETAGELSGSSITATGDLNGDGQMDFAIGAYIYNNSPGRTYVIFGGPQVGNTGLLPLSSLNGMNGFKVDGDTPGALSGGDLNGDHYSDLLLGCPQQNNSSGSAYVIFGSPRIGNSGSVSLSNLNGVNGFRLNGETAGDQLGFSLSALGDINGDSIVDLLIGTPNYNSFTGRSYVLFGDVPPIIVNNSLVLSQWETLQLNSSMLAAWDQNHSNETLIFTPTNVRHGRFEAIINPGISVANFTQQQIWNKEIQFVHDGSYHAPAYDMTVRSEGIAWTGPASAKIIFTPALQSVAQFPPLVQLSDLNGQTGFKIIGDATNDQSGRSVSSAGDMNGDGWIDILIGAPFSQGTAGCSYVVFGGADVAGSGVFNLNSLDGINGFRLNGENAGDYSGNSANPIGDINGDGYDDILIGAYSADPGGREDAGRSYVIFGGIGVGSSGLLDLASLNGSNGFKIDGEAPGDWSGGTTSALDVNSDGYPDLLIGANHALNLAGRSYIVFGGSDVGNTGLINLSSLNGINGFKMDGEVAGDQSGVNVGYAGDVNGDGYEDFLIGAAYANPDGRTGAGRCYLIFGGKNVGSSSLLNLASLDGTNGFKLDGEVAGDGLGSWVSAAEDVNGDGYQDMLLGAWHASPNGKAQAGRSYVVFGSPNVGMDGVIAMSTLDGTNGFRINGEAAGDLSGHSVSGVGDIDGDGFGDILIGAGDAIGGGGRSYILLGGVGIGNTGVMNLTDLNGFNGFKLDGEAGQGQSGFPVSNAGDVNQDGIVDFLIGAPGYSRSYLIFGDSSPVLVNNSLVVLNNKTVLINSSDLAAYAINHDDQNLIFVLSNVAHGQFELVSDPGFAVVNFTQQNITEGQVQFVYDGSMEVPSYDVTVRSSGMALTGPASAEVILFPQNSLVINQGQVVLLTSAILNATQASGEDGFLIFNVSDVTHGHFSEIDFPDQSLLSFYQQNITDQKIEFNHDGSTLAPTYRVSVSNGKIQTNAVPAVVTFYKRPVITANQLSIHQGETVVLTAESLAVSDDYPTDEVNFIVSSVQYGQFQLLPTNVSITEFSEEQLNTGQVMFTQNGSINAPSYQVSASDPYFTLPPLSSRVTFYPQPIFIANQLSVLEGQTVLLTPSMLSVMDGYPDSQVTFVITSLQHGRFEFIPAGNLSTPQFTQQQVKTGQIQFTHDNTPQAPNYTVTATDGFFTVGPVVPQINFSLVDKPPMLLHPIPPETFAIGEGFSFKIADDTFYDEQGKPITLSSTLSDGAPLPDPDIMFDPPSATFTGLVSEAATFNISVKGTSVAGLTTPAYFLLHIAGQLPDSPSSIDIKTLASVLGSLAGVALPVLGFLYARYHSNHMREKQDLFASKIHKRLNLSYGDFYHDNGGKEFKKNINEMKQLLIAKKSDVDFKDAKQQTRYADIFAQVIGDKKEDLIYKVHCGCSQELKFDDLEKRHEAIVERVIEIEQNPVEDVKPSKSCCSFFRCRKLPSDDSRTSLLLQ